ncbi:MAG: hypothetical protein ABF991_00275 [Liquorilactobacillus hordei]|uniref:hypothetical protein n=1 Tax=Liquorilactobacillus hordei TaxID=468911 RepID=UPI0039EC8390
MNQKKARKWFNQLKGTKGHRGEGTHEIWVEDNVLFTRNMDNGVISQYDKYGFVISTEII